MSSEKENSQDIISLNQKFDQKDKKISDFSELIEKIQSATQQMKNLWIEIYNNAIEDRMNAMLLYIDLSKTVFGSPLNHTQNGKLLTHYIERMNKANDQLTKLAELIDKSIERAEQVNGEDLYDEEEFGG